MKLSADKIIQPLLSEKAARRESKFNEFTVVVAKDMTKPEIAMAVEKLFGVKPLAVRTVVFRKKTKRNKFIETAPKSYKKALVRLPEGKRLELK
jgi:large subunit ribosomal protein L23